MLCLAVELLEDLLKLNVRSTTLMMKLVVPGMVAKKSGWARGRDVLVDLSESDTTKFVQITDVGLWVNVDALGALKPQVRNQKNFQVRQDPPTFDMYVSVSSTCSTMHGAPLWPSASRPRA